MIGVSLARKDWSQPAITIVALLRTIVGAIRTTAEPHHIGVQQPLDPLGSTRT